MKAHGFLQQFAVRPRLNHMNDTAPHKLNLCARWAMEEWNRKQETGERTFSRRPAVNALPSTYFPWILLLSMHFSHCVFPASLKPVSQLI